MTNSIENHLFKTTEMLVQVLGKQFPCSLTDVIIQQQDTIAELRRQLQMTLNEMGSRVNKTEMQKVFSGTNTVHKDDGTIKVM